MSPEKCRHERKAKIQSVDIQSVIAEAPLRVKGRYGSPVYRSGLAAWYTEGIALRHADKMPMCVGHTTKSKLFPPRTTRYDKFFPTFTETLKLMKGNDIQWGIVDESISDVYHVYSNGKKSLTLFYDDRDFIRAVNLLARHSYEAGCKVLAYTFCDTHFHFMVNGRRADVVNFIGIYKRGLLNYLTRTYGNTKEFDVEVAFKEVETSTQARKTICYILRNSLDANKLLLPVYCRWSSASLYFADLSKIEGTAVRISDLTLRQQVELLRTRFKAPSDWLVDGDGMFLPSCFVDYGSVNNLFKTANAFLAFMHFRKEDESAIARGLANDKVERLSDKELRAKIAGRSKELFNKSASALTLREKIALAVFLQRDYPTAQLARVLEIDAGLLGEE